MIGSKDTGAGRLRKCKINEVRQKSSEKNVSSIQTEEAWRGEELTLPQEAWDHHKVQNLAAFCRDKRTQEMVVEWKL